MTLDRDREGLEAALYRAASLYNAPPYVKAAGLDQLRPGAGAAPHLFADPAARDLPLHTPAATWLSAATYLESRGTRPPGGHYHEAAASAYPEGTLARIAAAADYWGIRGDVDAVATKAAAAARADDDALPDDRFAVVTVDDGGVKERHLRLAGPLEIKAAAAWIGRHRDEFYYDDRRAIARRILARADEGGVALGDEAGEMLAKMAGYGGCARSSALDLIHARALAAAPRDAKLAADLRDLEGAVAAADGAAIRAPALLAKLAATVDRCDRAAGLVGSYGRDLDRPEEVLFAVTAKVAADFVAGHVAAPDGAVYPRAALARLPLPAVRDHMGAAFADSVADSTGLFVDAAKLAAAVPALDRGDAAALARLADDSGVARVCDHPAAARAAALPDLAAVAAVLG